jgi:predicted transcriptional regulator
VIQTKGLIAQDKASHSVNALMTDSAAAASSIAHHPILRLLKHALKHPFTAYTVVSHQTSHSVSYQTAKNDLESLVAKTLLIRGKQAKAFIYTPAQNLATLLEK